MPPAHLHEELGLVNYSVPEQRSDEGAGAPSRQPCIWYHGGRGYSADGQAPIVVTFSQHNILKAFLAKQAALTTEELEKAAGESNVVRTIKQLAEQYDGRFAPAIRTPAGKKNAGGYFIRVRPLKPPEPN